MTAIKASEADRFVDRFVARPGAAPAVVLVHGPDAGLVRERTDALVRASVDDVSDPFALARVDGDELSGNPARLIEEAHTVPLFGGRRAVLVKAGARNIASAVEIVIASPSPDCRVIIEAGELRKNAPLRVVCEKAKGAVALACYPDNERDLARLIDQEMRAANLTLADDARGALIAALGGDRMASRNEIRKLALYAHGKKRVELDDVMAVVSDASGLELNGLLDAVFAGRTGDVEVEFNKARAGGSSPSAILSASVRQSAALHKTRLAIEAGEDVEAAMKRSVPPIHFTRLSLVGAALRTWSSARLLRAMEQLAESSLEARRQASLAEVIAQRTLLSLAVNARRKER